MAEWELKLISSIHLQYGIDVSVKRNVWKVWSTDPLEVLECVLGAHISS